MPRNVSGTYTLPLPPVVPNTTIESDWANETLADIAQSLTDSLDRTGRGGLTAPFRLVDGTAAQPGLSFNAETGTGLYRAAPGQMGVTVMGTPVGGWTDDGFSGLFVQIDGNPTFTGIPVFDDGLTTNGLVIATGFRAALGDGSAPSYEWWNTAAPTDKQRYVAYGSAAGDWTFQSMSDTGTIADHWFALRRPPTGDAGAGLPGWFFGGAGNSLMTLEGSSGVVVFGLDATAASIPRAIQFRTNGKPRWNIEVAGAETGGSTGGSLGFARANDAGTYLGPVLRLFRDTGVVEMLEGNLQLKGSAGHPDPNYAMYAVAEGNTNSLTGFKAGTGRWQLQLGDTNSNFAVHRFDTSGNYLGTPFQIDRSNGWATFANNLTVGGLAQVNGTLTANGTIQSVVHVVAQQQLVSWSSIEVGHPSGGSTPFIDFHTSSGSDFDSRIIAFPGSLHVMGPFFQVDCNTDVVGNIVVRQGVLYVHQPAGGYPQLILENDSNFRKAVRVNGASNDFEVLNATLADHVFIASDGGRICARSGYCSKAGSSTAVNTGGSVWNYQWDGNVAIWIDTTRIGWINVSTSDERVKHSIEPMGLLDEAVFAKIAPIKFRWQNVGPFIDDGHDHWGFSAQNLLEVAPVAVKGGIDEVGPGGEIYPANVDLMAILGQTILQLQALQARCTAAGI